MAHSLFQLIGPKETTWVRRLRLRMILDDDGYHNGFQAIAGVVCRCLLEIGGRELPDTLRVNGFTEVNAIPAHYHFCQDFQRCRVLGCKIFVSGKRFFLLEIETHMLASECDATTWDVFSSCLEAALRTNGGPVLEDRMRDVYTSSFCNFTMGRYRQEVAIHGEPRALE